MNNLHAFDCDFQAFFSSNKPAFIKGENTVVAAAELCSDSGPSGN